MSLTPTQIVEDVLRRIAARGEDGVWIARVSEAELRQRAKTLERLGTVGRPLFGMTFAVKDNIDVAGMMTTAGCPDFAYTPPRSAAAVERLEDAGAILIGKTNLDQFATGLVGTRSPYGIPENPYDATYIPGGSSSGSAVAVAARLVDFALGTDTAGSGRVPAGFNNIVGIKPSIGLISTDGVVPACRSLDCVSIFAPNLSAAMRVLEVAGHAPVGGMSKPERFEFAVPRADALRFFGDAEYERLFVAAVARLEGLGGRRREIDYAPFAEAADCLYSDAGVAERVAAVGDFLRDHPGSVLSVTRAIIERGRNVTDAEVYRMQERLARLRGRVAGMLADIDVLVLPTAGTIYRIAEVEADPIALNTNLGYYTNFVNPMNLAAISIPAGFRPDGLPFGITLVAPAGQEARIASVALKFERAQSTDL